MRLCGLAHPRFHASATLDPVAQTHPVETHPADKTDIYEGGR